MDHFLVVGTDTVAGLNIAATFGAHHQVSTWAPDQKYDVPNCDALDPDLTAQQVVKQAQPECIIYCGPAARSSWDPTTIDLINDQMVEDAQTWASLAKTSGCKFVMISSDAVFTGPWMFHDEDSPGLCHSYQSLALRATEQQVEEVCTDALIVRTHVFGWSGQADGWVEQLLEDIESHRVVDQDHIRHASPILATDLAEILLRACEENLTGTFHVNGAERVNPLKFAQRLADRFNLPWLALRKDSVMHEVPAGFGEGECSLQTKRIRKALCVAMPLLTESLDRLVEQQASGYKASLEGQTSEATTARAA